MTKGVGVFARLGWNAGQTPDWAMRTCPKSGSAGLSINGDFWHRPNDTVGLAGIINGISRVQQEFFRRRRAGHPGWRRGGTLELRIGEKLEVYYKAQIWKSFNATADYQYVIDPAYNAARGPVSILASVCTGIFDLLQASPASGRKVIHAMIDTILPTRKPGGEYSRRKT